MLGGGVKGGEADFPGNFKIFVRFWYPIGECMENYDFTRILR